MASRWTCAILAALAFAAGASRAAADCAITLTPLNGTSLGKIVGPSQTGGQATTFTIPTGSGPVTQVPSSDTTGAAILLYPPSDFQLQAQITSGAGCDNSITVTITGVSTGSPSVTFPTSAFALQAVSGITSLSPSSVSSGGTFTLTFAQSGIGSVAVFNIGTAITLPATAPSGILSWTTTVLP
jgi:hypothetical protein